MKKKIVRTEHIPEIQESIRQLPDEDKVFVDRSLEIAHFIAGVLNRKNFKQKDLAQLLGKSEAEVSKLLRGLHNYTLRSLAKIEAALGEPIICTPVNNNIELGYTKCATISGITAKHIDQAQMGQVHYNKGRVVHMRFTISELTEVKAI